MPNRALSTPLDDSFKRYLQDKGKGHGGDGRNYRRNASRELERFAEWAAARGLLDKMVEADRSEGRPSQRSRIRDGDDGIGEY